MMAFDFPNSPTTGQQFTPAGGPTYTWNGYAWALSGTPMAGVLNQQVFTASGTYTPTPGMQTAIIECVGGGGGGNGCPNTGNVYSGGGGGGSGGYSRKLVTAAQVGASQVVTIGAGGTGAAAAGASANPGGAGSDTSVGALCVAKGARTAANYVAAGLGGLPGTGDIASPGNFGQAGSSIGTPGAGTAYTSGGAGSIFGGGAAVVAPGTSGNGANATGYGAGGAGGFSYNASTAYAGGNGSAGLVIITEYANVSTGVATGATSHTGGFINKLRNGTFDVAQRGTGGSQGTGAAAYTLDGWILGLTGAATSWSQQYNMQMSGNVLQINSSVGMTQAQLYQRIESSIAAQLLNYNKTAQPVTIQFTIYNNTGNPLTPQLQTGFPTAKDNFATVTTDIGPVSLQTIAPGQIGTVAYTFTPNVSCQLGYQVMLLFGAQLAAGTLIHVGYADLRATPGLLTGLNNNPPPVELRPIATEMTFCHRYYQSHVFVGCPNGQGTAIVGQVNYHTTMRATPSLVISPTGYVTLTSALDGVTLNNTSNTSAVNSTLTASAEL